MLSVVLIWFYIAATAGAVGWGILRGFRYRPRRLVSYWLAGLAACTVYAEAWSLFGGVGLAANLILLAGCTAVLVLNRRDLPAAAKRLTDALSENELRTVIGCILLLILAAATTTGNWHTDTPLYHAQAVHWIEQYGAVKGLGNLQSHFAYNNSCFCLYALYSFHWLGGESFHAVQGFLAALLALLCTDLLSIPALRARGGHVISEGRHLETADILRLAAAVQLVLLADELVSPSSDSFILILEHLVMILWVEYADREDYTPYPYGWLTMLVIWAVTVKLAAAPLLLLGLYPIGKLLFGKSRDYRAFGRFVLTALLITAPFFIREIILSGWILYPVLPEHIVELPWQVPDGVGQFESFEISQNGRMIFDMNEADTSLFGWEAAWLARQPRAGRLMFYGTVLAAVLAILHGLYRTAMTSVTELSLTFAFVFWFFTTPQLRFGEGYMLLLSAAVYGRLFVRLGEKLEVFRRGSPDAGRPGVPLAGTRPSRASRLLPAVWHLAEHLAVGVFLATLVAMLRLSAGSALRDHALLQQDYDRYPVDTYEIDGIALYYPTEFVYTGYYAFPATRWQVEGVRALGSSVRDGFAIVTK